MNKIKIYLMACIYYKIKNLLRYRKQKGLYKIWIANNKPSPPPSCIKQSVILEYAKKYKINLFVETGTYKGDMVEATKRHFNKIYSIELSKNLYNRAKIRFAFDNNIFLINGDSGEKIKIVLSKLKEPAIFWLDGHYSGGSTSHGDIRTPIYKELENIFKITDNKHIIIIDDVRVFGVEPDYPAIDELIKYINKDRNIYDIEIKYDSIRLVPKTYLRS